MRPRRLNQALVDFDAFVKAGIRLLIGHRTRHSLYRYPTNAEIARPPDNKSGSDLLGQHRIVPGSPVRGTEARVVVRAQSGQ
jgi:hypothetical protein